jgi:aminopeptidase-like protein
MLTPCDFNDAAAEAAALDVRRIQYLQHNFHAVFLIKDIFCRLKLHNLFSVQKLLSQNPDAIIPEEVSQFTETNGTCLDTNTEFDGIGSQTFPLFFAKDLDKYNDLVTVNYSELYATSRGNKNDVVNKNDAAIPAIFHPLLHWSGKDLDKTEYSDVYGQYL